MMINGEVMKIAWRTGHTGVCHVTDENETHVKLASLLFRSAFGRPRWVHRDHIVSISPLPKH